MTGVALGVVVIAIVATAGILVITSQSSLNTSSTQSLTQSTTYTTMHSAPNITTNNAISTICIVPVEGAGTYLRVVSDLTQQPLPGIVVHVLPKANSCSGESIPGPVTYTTNVTGWVSMGSQQANYYFQTSLIYNERNYSFILPQGPLDVTNATLRLPSGNLTISLCYTMATTNPCKPYIQSTESNTSTQSAYGGSEVSSPLRVSMETWSSTGPNWNFTVLINTNSPTQGQPIQLVAKLTNVGSANETIPNFIEPYINPEVRSANGTTVWAWDPPQETWPTWTIPSGQTLTQSVTIPTSQLHVGQKYTIEVVPLSIPSIPPHGNMTITMQFSVG